MLSSEQLQDLIQSVEQNLASARAAKNPMDEMKYSRLLGHLEHELHMATTATPSSPATPTGVK